MKQCHWNLLALFCVPFIRSTVIFHSDLNAEALWKWSSHVKLLIITSLCLVGQNLLLHYVVMKMWHVILCRNTHVESSYIIDEGWGMCMPFLLFAVRILQCFKAASYFCREWVDIVIVAWFSSPWLVLSGYAPQKMPGFIWVVQRWHSAADGLTLNDTFILLVRLPSMKQVVDVRNWRHLIL